MNNLTQNYFILYYVYYSPLHVSSNVVLIIRRSNFFNTASVIVTARREGTGEQFPLDLHTGRPLTDSDYTRCCVSTI